MSDRSSGWSGSIPTITFQWCFSQNATISSPLGIVRTRTTAGRLSDHNFAILDSLVNQTLVGLDLSVPKEPAWPQDENLHITELSILDENYF